jgi:general secretion pathway protein F
VSAPAVPAFDYTVLSADGRTMTGRIEAADRADAARRLQAIGHMPVEVAPAGTGLAAPAAERARHGGGSMPPRELARLTRGLALLLGAGLPLDAALEAMADVEARPAPRRLLQALRDGVRRGTGFGAAVATRSAEFPGWYAAAVGAAEGTGRLPEVLDRLSAELLRAARTAERLRAGLTYPAVVLALAVVAVGVLVAVVLPALEPLFAASAGQLPASTRAVLAGGAVLRDWGAPGLALLLASGLLVARTGASVAVRRWRDARVLHLPLLGPIARSAAAARVARVLATLLGAGVPLTEALGQAAASAGNAAVAAALERGVARVAAGQRLAAALADEGALPKLAITLVGVGEEGGRLREMLREVAVIHEEEMDRAVERLLALLVPGVTLLLGGLVGGIVLATLDAILGANSAALGSR